MRTRRKGQRGAAMTEVAVTLPIFLLILSGMFYFQRANKFSLRAHRAARYAAWHRANTGPDGGAGRSQSAGTLRQIHFANQPNVLMDQGTCSFGNVLTGSGSTCGQSGYSDDAATSVEGSNDILSRLSFNFNTYTVSVRVTWDQSFGGGNNASVRSHAAVHDNYSPRNPPSIVDLVFN